MSTPEFRERRRLYMAEYRKRHPELKDRRIELDKQRRIERGERPPDTAAERSAANAGHEADVVRPVIATRNAAPVVEAMTHREYMERYYGKGKTANWSSSRKTQVALA